MNVIHQTMLTFAARDGNPSPTLQRKRLAFSIARTSTTLMNNWKSQDELVLVMLNTGTHSDLFSKKYKKNNLRA